MSLSTVIAPHLPYLRRFARVISGSQQAGDSYVVTTLEALIAEPGSFDTSLPSKIALYKMFLQIWRSVNPDGPRVRSTDARPAEGGLAAIDGITPLPRQAFLLATIEGFDVAEIAKTLGMSEVEVSDLLDAAGREISDQIATDVLIIEDEPIIALDLENIVENLGHRVLGVARTHREAVAAVSRHAPGLVLADVQLADGSSGLDAVNEILSGYNVPVIFVTAYPERLLTGERPEPTFLITKPFQTETLKAVISQALFFDTRAHHPDRIAAGA